MSEKQIQESNQIMLTDTFSNWLRKQARLFSTWVILAVFNFGMMILVLVLKLTQAMWKTRA